REGAMGGGVQPGGGGHAQCVPIRADEIRTVAFGPVAGGGEVAAGAEPAAQAHALAHAIRAVQVDGMSLIVVAGELLVRQAIAVSREPERVRRPAAEPGGKAVRRLPLEQELDAARVAGERV